MEITLCDKRLTGDILTHEEKTAEEGFDLIDYWLENKDFSKSVFVSFLTFEGWGYKDEIKTIIVTHRWDDLVDFYQTHISLSDYIDRSELNNDVRFSIYEFDTYEEAFKYCIDLKEGL